MKPTPLTTRFCLLWLCSAVLVLYSPSVATRHSKHQFIQRHPSLAFVPGPTELLGFDSVAHHYYPYNAGTKPEEASTSTPPCPRSFPPIDISEPELSGILLHVQKVVEQVWAKRPAPFKGAASIAMVYNQELIFSQNFGVANESRSSAPPTLDTIYRIGSITKVFTDVLLQVMVEKGLVSQEDDASFLMPGLEFFNPFPGAPKVTLEQLGSHMSGLPRNSHCIPFVNDVSCNFSKDEIISQMSQIPLVRPPGTLPSYSNIGFSLLGAILGHVVDPKSQYPTQVFQDAVLSLTKKLEMNSTTFEAPSENLAQGYTRPWFYGLTTNKTTIKASVPNLGFANPAGGIFTSTRDMVQFMKLLLRTRQPRNESAGQILSGEAIVNMFHPRYNEPTAAVPPFMVGLPFEVCTLGLHLNKLLPCSMNSLASQLNIFACKQTVVLQNVGWIFGKSGDAPGYNAQMLLLPAINAGVFVVLSNDAHVIAANKVENRYTSHNFSYAALNTLAYGLLPLLQEKDPTTPSSPPPSVVAAMVGDYRVITTLGNFSTSISLSKNPNLPAQQLFLSAFGGYLVYDDSLVVKGPKYVFKYTHEFSPSCLAQFDDLYTEFYAYFYANVDRPYLVIPSFFGESVKFYKQ